MDYKVRFIKPMMPKAEDLVKEYDAIVESNWFSNFGPYEKRLSEGLAKYVGNGSYATTVSNATLGLMLALRSLIPKEALETKKQVIIPSFTFAAGPEALLWCGLEPVFVDINKDTWQADVSQAEKYIEENPGKVVGLLFCNAFGVGAAEVSDWEALASKHKIPLVIDSAAGFGSAYEDDSRLGTRGDCEVFSFHATKPFGVGEGGAIISRSKDLINSIRALENFGFDSERRAHDIGLNAKMQEINSAIGLWQLDHFQDALKIRQSNLELYKKALEPIGFTFQPNDSNSSVCFASVLTPSHEVAKKLYTVLRENGIEVNRYYNPPLHEHPAFSGLPVIGELKATKDISGRILSLPAHHEVNETIIQEIVGIIKSNI